MIFFLPLGHAIFPILFVPFPELCLLSTVITTQTVIYQLMQSPCQIKALFPCLHVHIVVQIVLFNHVCSMLYHPIDYPPPIFSGGRESSENGVKPCANGEEHCESKLLSMSHVSSKQFGCLILLFGYIFCRQRRRYFCCQ